MVKRSRLLEDFGRGSGSSLDPAEPKNLVVYVYISPCYLRRQ